MPYVAMFDVVFAQWRRFRAVCPGIQHLTPKPLSALVSAKPITR